MKTFDCIVVGGGMVGAASALSLAELGLRIAVIEQRAPSPFASEQPYDMRVSAISLASQHVLQQLGAWRQIEAWRVCPYRRLGVWEQESSYIEFNAKEIEQPYLGHIVENRLIQLALWQQLQSHENITLFCPETVVGIQQSEMHAQVELSSQSLQGKIVIGADGAHSKVRALSHIGSTGWDYDQAAMLVNVTTEQTQQDITWQQFFPSGPVALLPLPENNASLVWYHKKEEIKRLTALSNEQLQQEILRYFPKRVGQIVVQNKAAFPLTRRHANQYVKNRVVLVGDAAHTINPMAGQGVNLGFKDVNALQQVIASAMADEHVWHSANTLRAYQQKRRLDNLLMMSTMDGLYMSFSHISPMAKFARNFSLSLVDKLPRVKRKALAYACGI